MRSRPLRGAPDGLGPDACDDPRNDTDPLFREIEAARSAGFAKFLRIPPFCVL